MPFFEPLPPEPDSSVPVPTGWVPPAWDRPSEAILGAPVPVNELLAKTEELAVAFSHVDAVSRLRDLGLTRRSPWSGVDM